MSFVTQNSADAPRRPRIVDAQVHVWRPNSRERSWPDDAADYLRATAVLSSAARAPMGGDELVALLDEHGVDEAILVPPVFAGDDNGYAVETAEAHPGRFHVMGRVPLDESAGRRELETWPDRPVIVGARLTFFWPRHRAQLDAGGAEWFWRFAERHRIPVAVLCPGRVPEIGEVARRHPELRIIVDHFGMDLELKDDAALAAIPELVKLSSLENVAVKASTLPSYVTESYPFPSLADPVRRVVDAFGARRVFWGSELTRLPVPYADAIRHITEGLDFLSEDDRAWILGRGAREWLGIA
jgi:L-fuconolactonase